MTGGGLWHSFAIRLSLWFAAVFTLSAVVLFALLYFLLASFFEQSEREVIQARLKECAANLLKFSRKSRDAGADLRVRPYTKPTPRCG